MLCYEKKGVWRREVGTAYQVSGDFEVGKGDRFVLSDSPTLEVGHSKFIERHDQLLACH